MAGRRREQGPISCAKLWPRALAAQHRDLVAQDHQLDLGRPGHGDAERVRPAGPERDVEEGEGHYRRSTQPTPRRADTSSCLQPFRGS